MESTPMHPHANALLAQDAWIRRLARALVSDVHAAEDLAQDTWVELLRGAERDRSRGWIATVTRNAARRGGRAERARRLREQAGAREEALPAAGEIVERAERARSLAGHVLELDEPYRAVVLLRWFEGLPPRRIAERLERPVATVKNQLAEGHARLRQRLEREHGAERWTTALAPLLVPRASAWTAGALVALALLVGGLAVLAAAKNEVPRTGLGGAGVADSAPVVAQDPVRSTAPAVHLVVDGHGVPLVGIPVAWVSETGAVLHRGSTGADGTLGFSPSAAGSLRSEHADLRVAADGLLRTTSIAPGRHVWVLTRFVSVDFEIRSAGSGERPLRSRVRLRADGLAGFPLQLEESPTREWTHALDEARGILRVEGPSGAPYVLEAGTRIGFGWLDEAESAAGLELRSDPGLAGRVVDADGRALRNAIVDFGHARTRTNAAGEFELAPVGEDLDHVLTAWVKGRRPAAIRGLGPLLEATGGRLVGLELVVEDLPLEIHGRALDVDGAPLADAFVTLRDGTPFGSFGSSIEHETAVGSGIGVETDADGRFVLGGLMDREYAVQVHVDKTYLTLVAPRVRAGSEVVLRAPEDAFAESLHGRIRDLTGQPVAGAAVGLEVELTWNGFTGVSSTGREVQTDEDGRFELADAPWRNLRLAVSGAGIETLSVEIADPAQPIDVMVRRQYLFRLEVEDDAADGASFVSANDRVLTTHLDLPNNYLATRDRIDLAEAGRRVEGEVTGTPRWLVLFRGDQELRRVRVDLVSGERTRVRLED